MSILNVRIKKIRPNAILPEYQTIHSAGMDLHACIDEPITVNPMQRLVVPTGLVIELPEGYESQIRARSGMALKHGLTMANGIGTIESDYRGEYGVLVINLGNEPFVIEPNMRIAQLIISKYEKVIWQEAIELSETERGDGGFGSTGK